MTRPVPLHPERAVTLKAWRCGPENPRHEAIRVDLPESVNTPEEAAQAALVNRGEMILVLRSDAAERPERRNVLSVYLVKRRSRPPRRWSTATGGYVTQPAEYPVLIGRVCVPAFDPQEPWRWAPGADVVGHDRTLIEGE